MAGPDPTPPPPGGVSRSPTRVPDRPGAVLLSTLGSLGDLYPVLSVARALRDLGLEPRLALTPDDVTVAESWGLPATPLGPSRAEICERLGVTLDDIAAAVLRDPRPLLREVLMPLLPDLVAQLHPLIPGTGLVAATPFALAAPLAAEQAGLPYVPLLLQPAFTLSAHDPPRQPWTGLAPRPPGHPLHLWNRTLTGLVRWLLRRSLTPALTRARAALDLPAPQGTPLVDHGAHVPVQLGLWDVRFCARPDDSRTLPVGFPPSPLGALPLEASRWIDAGPPPLVITLGSIAQGLGGARFWQEATALARQMGLRAILLHGAAPVPQGDDLLALPYAPHAELFPRAAAILHHGGMGSSAEALRAGRPQIVVPVGGDQFDNAARLQALGVATTLPLPRFTAHRARPRLSALLDRFDYTAAATLADQVRATDGAAAAARHLAQQLRP